MNVEDIEFYLRTAVAVHNASPELIKFLRENGAAKEAEKLQLRLLKEPTLEELAWHYTVFDGQPIERYAAYKVVSVDGEQPGYGHVLEVGDWFAMYDNLGGGMFCFQNFPVIGRGTEVTELDENLVQINWSNGYTVVLEKK